MQKYRKKIISTTAEDVKSFAPVMSSILKQNYSCVVGGEEKIEENKDSFSSIKNVIPSEDEIGQVLDRENKESVDANKVWEIKYEKEISPLTINNENVNEKYTLVIKNMKSLDPSGREDKTLSDINMDFTIKK